MEFLENFQNSRECMQLEMVGKWKRKEEVFFIIIFFILCESMINEIKSERAAGCIWIEMLGTESYSSFFIDPLHACQSTILIESSSSSSVATEKEMKEENNQWKEQRRTSKWNDLTMTIMDNHTKLWVSMSELKEKNFRLQCKWPRSCLLWGGENSFKAAAKNPLDCCTCAQ